MVSAETMTEAKKLCFEATGFANQKFVISQRADLLKLAGNNVGVWIQAKSGKWKKTSRT